jgi:ribosomal protein L11 methyltransferase
MPSTQTTYRLELSVPAADVDGVTGLLARLVSFGWEERGTDGAEAGSAGDRAAFVLHCDDPAFLRDVAAQVGQRFPLASAEIDGVASTDWLAAWKDFFEPVTCGGRFVVLPPWRRDEPGFDGRTRILIEPGSAFGTGHHATTALCLAALGELLDGGRVGSGERFLDLGTGSGILGIACCTQGLQGLCLDIDPIALDNARANVILNGVSGCRMELGSLEKAQGPYGLIVANILAGPLAAMAGDVVRLLGGGGWLVLSGILSGQASGVEAAYREQGLRLIRRMGEGEWVALVLGGR